MRRIAGVLLLVAAGALLYHFGILGAFHAKGMANHPTLGLPFLSLGSDWPLDAISFVGALWAGYLGLLLIVTDRTPGRSIGMAGRFHLLNSMLLVSMLFVAYVGARTGQDPKMVGRFVGIGALQIAVGLLLLLVSFSERPKAAFSMFLGTVLWLGGAAAGLYAFLQG